MRLVRAFLVPAVLLCGVLVGASVLLLTEPAPARPGGVEGHSSNPGFIGASNCSECHSGAIGDAPTITITSPSPVTAGVVSLVTVTIAGGPGVVGGFNASFDDFLGLPMPVDGETRQAGPEITHAAPKAFANDRVSFTFSWTPPNDTSIALYAAGLSANGNGSLIGDAVATTAITIQIVQPEPTPTVTATAIPTATPLPTATAQPTATPTPVSGIATPVPTSVIAATPTPVSGIPTPVPTSVIAATPTPVTLTGSAAGQALAYPGPFTKAPPSGTTPVTGISPAIPAIAAPAAPPAGQTHAGSSALAVTASPTTRDASMGLWLLVAGATLTVYSRRRR